MNWLNFKKKFKKLYEDNFAVLPDNEMRRKIFEHLYTGVPYTGELTYQLLEEVHMFLTSQGPPYSVIPLAHTEPAYNYAAGYNPHYEAAMQNLHAQEEKPMRDDFIVKTSANTINIAPAAQASVNTKSDLAIQRDFLINELDRVDSSIRWGDISKKMRSLFNIDVDNTPKTAKELIEGIQSGKFTLDTKKQARQDIKIADRHNDIYDEDEDEYVPGRDPLYAMNFGGLTPDRVGFEQAKSDLFKMAEAAKRTIMIKTPDEGLAAIQAIEAWTPAATAAS